MRKMLKRSGLISKIGMGFLAALTALIGVVGITSGAQAATSDTIEVTATPAWVAISVTPDSWLVNSLPDQDATPDPSPALRTGDSLIRRNATYYSNPTLVKGNVTGPAGATWADSECLFTLTNNSTVTADIYVSFPNFTGGQTMTNGGTGTPGANTFGAYTYVSGGSAAGILAVADNSTDKVKADVAADNGTFKFGLKLLTQTAKWTVQGTMTSTVLVSAFEAGETATYD